MGHSTSYTTVATSAQVQNSTKRRARYDPLSIVAMFLGIIGIATFISLTFLGQIDGKLRFIKGFDFDDIADHCKDIPPIRAETYVQRQDSLAQILYSINASAYVAEPGANAAYFANVSSAHWHISERPLLLIIQPVLDKRGEVHANVSILTPYFEATRAKLLPIPSASEITFPEWKEHEDPYAAVISAIQNLENDIILVDDAIRHFIVDGLQQASPSTKVVSAPMQVRRLRERKTKEEIDILKCANEATVLAIRAAREKMYIGMRESEARALITTAMSIAGLQNAGALTLFGENAALPHGSGTDRVLGKHDFILIDAGGTLHGYVSDVTRTFVLRSSVISDRQFALWRLVRKAQTAAFDKARNGTRAADVDSAARHVINEVGLGEYFTHRLGHGIGIEGHESPYLRGGAEDIILTGHTFSDEPGVYIEGDVGIRLEDCFYIDEDGKSVYLTDGVGGQSSSPWLP
ncbi:hypothetical protein QCA50_003233 [Cerrena zonata]|uniref:Peptidase M24 domain-containing protein n=1 Tax=Cerrena zonata TaxID=2478898 RepID=A0AAW0GTJ0_9APHY